MRAITTATAAVALGMERKALDNLLLQLGPLALPTGRQGVERRIPVALLETLAMTTDLVNATGMRIREAFELSSTLIASADRSASPDEVGAATLGPYLRLEAELGSLRRELTQRLELAIETVVRRPRGRPRRRGARHP